MTSRTQDWLARTISQLLRGVGDHDDRYPSEPNWALNRQRELGGYETSGVDGKTKILNIAKAALGAITPDPFGGIWSRPHAGYVKSPPPVDAYGGIWSRTHSPYAVRRVPDSVLDYPKNPTPTALGMYYAGKFRFGTGGRSVPYFGPPPKPESQWSGADHRAMSTPERKRMGFNMGETPTRADVARARGLAYHETVFQHLPRPESGAPFNRALFLPRARAGEQCLVVTLEDLMVVAVCAGIDVNRLPRKYRRWNKRRRLY